MDELELEASVAKVPAITLGFWIIKIAATTLGETAGDAVTLSMNLGYLTGTLIFAGILIATLSAQIAARRFHPYLYWGVILATTTVGTTLADLVDRSLGIGYAGGASLLFVLVLVSLGLWYRSEGSVSVSRIASHKAELFYWITIQSPKPSARRWATGWRTPPDWATAAARWFLPPVWWLSHWRIIEPDFPERCSFGQRLS
jgi:uncharacterized membrane-anchored protein